MGLSGVNLVSVCFVCCCVIIFCEVRKVSNRVFCWNVQQTTNYGVSQSQFANPARLIIHHDE